MDLPTARRNLTAAQRELKTATDRFNELSATSARRRRALPDMPEAKQARDDARNKVRSALDEYNKARRRPRHTAPR